MSSEIFIKTVILFSSLLIKGIERFDYIPNRQNEYLQSFIELICESEI